MVTVGTAQQPTTDSVQLPFTCSSGGTSALATIGQCQLLLVLAILSGGTPADAPDAANAASSHHPAHHGKPHPKAVVIGSTHVTIPAGHHETVRITLNQTGRRLLAKDHTLKATLTITENGHTVRTLTITLKAKPPNKPKPKHH
jgi:hypothetical protein